MSKKIRIIMSVLIISSIILSNGISVFANKQYTDYKGHWAEKQISEFVSRGIIKGYSDGFIRPDNIITRKEFAAITNKVFGLTEKAEISFSDVPSGTWFADDVAKAVEAKYLDTGEQDRFKPDEPVTRLDAAKAIAILLKLDSSSDLQGIESFKDIEDISDCDKGYLGAVVCNKCFSGYDDGTFKPLRTITRAETITVLYNALDVHTDSVQSAEQQFSGWLEDVHCSKMIDDPAKGTKACLLMKNCQASGYGIIIKDDRNAYKFLKFDDNGNKLALEVIKTFTKEKDLRVIVNGTVERDTIKVSKIVEVKEQLYEGILIDKHCFAGGKPELDPKGCLLMASCAASGYGVAVKQADGSYKFYLFDENGQKLAKEILNTTAKDSNITVSVTGTFEGEIIKVSSISEK